MESSCVPVGPTFSGDFLVAGVLKPVPIAFGEVRKLCQIEQTRVGSHFECVRETRGISIEGMGPADPQPFAAGTLRVTSAAGISEESPLSLKRVNLAHPDWEVLSPSVVIRRRPKRMQGLRLT